MEIRVGCGKVLLIAEGDYLYNTSERYFELEQCVETIISMEDIKNIYVQHSGFALYLKMDIPDIDFSKTQELAHHLQSKISEEGLQVKLLHEGFVLKKNRKIEIDLAETEE